MFVVFVFLFTAVLSLKLCFLLPRFPFWQCLPWSRAGLQFVSSSSAPPPWPAWRTPVSKDISHFPAGSGSSGAELKISYLHRNKSFFRISGSKNSKAHDNFFFFFSQNSRSWTIKWKYLKYCFGSFLSSERILLLVFYVNLK